MSSLPMWLAFGLGLVIGAWASWERYIRREKPTVKWVVTPEVIREINNAMVAQWLDERGLCWMPKGKEISWPGEVKR